MADWQRRRILIWGKTRPEVSQNYGETVCTGGVFEDTKQLVRLYPIPLRYLDDERYFQKYQWITADVQRADDRDNRPESYRIRAEHLDLGDRIDTGKHKDWRARADWVINDRTTFASVEALQAQQAIDHTSLGIVRPKKIVQVHAETYPRAEQEQFWQKYKAVVAKIPLPFDEDERVVKPLTPSDFRFRVRFTCDDSACRGVHKFGILDWEVDALYFNLKQRHGSKEKAKHLVIQELEKRLMDPLNEPRFFLGNISTHPTMFTIVGLWYPMRPAPTLF